MLVRAGSRAARWAIVVALLLHVLQSSNMRIPLAIIGLIPSLSETAFYAAIEASK